MIKYCFNHPSTIIFGYIPMISPFFLVRFPCSKHWPPGESRSCGSKPGLNNFSWPCRAASPTGCLGSAQQSWKIPQLAIFEYQRHLVVVQDRFQCICKGIKGSSSLIISCLVCCHVLESCCLYPHVDYLYRHFLMRIPLGSR